MFELTDLFTGFAESPFTLLVIGYRPAQFLFAEVGPERIAEIEFGIGALPQQVVAEAYFATGTD